jgi:hypothetical protein
MARNQVSWFENWRSIDAGVYENLNPMPFKAAVKKGTGVGWGLAG